jgi:hypothetical protein
MSSQTAHDEMKFGGCVPICAGWLAGGALLWLLAGSRHDPVLWIAKLFSEHFLLSTEFANRIANSERIFAWIMMATAPIGLVVRHVWAAFCGMLFESNGKAFYGVLGATCVVLTWCIETKLFDGMPHITDAASHLFEAKILSAGHIYAPLPPCPEQFAQFHVLMTKDGKWFSKYTPGHALLLAAGMKLHAVDLVVPLCGAIAMLGSAWLARRFFSPSIGRVTGSLIAISPLFQLLGASYMSHTTSMAALVAAACAFVLSVDVNAASPRASRGWAVAAGFLAGLALLIRIQEALVVVCVASVAMLLVPRAVFRKASCLLPWAVIGIVPWMAFEGWWSSQVYGSYFRLGYGRGTDILLFPQYPDHYGLSKEFPLSLAMRRFVWGLSNLNRALFGWAVSFAFVPLGFLDRRFARQTGVCVAGVAAVLGLYFFYDYYGYEYEARYYGFAVPFLAVLSACGAKFACDGGSNFAWARRAVVVMVVVSFGAHSVVDYWIGYIVPKYGHDYESVSSDARRKASAAGLKNAVVLLGTGTGNSKEYSSGFAFNDPFLSGDVIFARDDQMGNACIREHFRDRKLYRFVPAAGGSSARLDRVP